MIDSSSLPQLPSIAEQVEGDTGLLKIGSKSLGKPVYTKWHESSLIKFHSSQSNLFLQTLQLQQTLFSSFQCDNNEHGTDTPSQILPTELVLELEKIKLHKCSAMLQKCSQLKLPVCAKYQTLRSSCQPSGFTIPYRADLRAFASLPALYRYHRPALKHCLPIIQKLNQYFKGLKD